jgi:hypothetical protein
LNTSHIPLPRPLEKEAHNKNLQPRHRHHQRALHQAKIEYPPLRTPDSAEIPILPRPEVFLIPADGRELRRELEYGFFEDGGLFGGGALFGGKLGIAGFVFDLTEPQG